MSALTTEMDFESLPEDSLVEGLTLVGVNHHTASTECRERLAFPPSKVEKGLEYLTRQNGLSEALILSTCNRVEMYCYSSPDGPNGKEAVLDLLRHVHGVDECEIQEGLFTCSGKDVVHHLFRVAASMDSMVVGEAQILGQVKDAYEFAQKHGASGPVLNALFQRAFSVAKRIRTETEIGRGRISISSVAVEFAEKIFQDLSSKGVMVLGAGETSELVLQQLHERGVRSIVVSNRTYERANELSRRYNAKAIHFDLFPDYLVDADILITSTSCPYYLVHPEGIRACLKKRRNKSIFIVDLAVPRDVHPAVGELDNVFLYDMDDLQAVVQTHTNSRIQEMSLGDQIVEREVGSFARRLSTLEVGGVIHDLFSELHSIRDEELRRLVRKLPSLDPDARTEIETMTVRIVNKILHRPMIAIKDHAREREGRHLAEVVRKLFDIRPPEDPE